jgi:hypothetical protein
MKTSRSLPLVCFLAAPLMGACGGGVDIAKTDGGGAGGGAQDDASLPSDAQGHVTIWDGGFVSGASGSPPTCNQAPLACTGAFPGQPTFASAQDIANAFVGQWSFCGRSGLFFAAPGQLGEEYAADGTYYALISGSGGQLVRNLDPTTIGTWAVRLNPNGGGLEIHTFGGNVQRSGGVSVCPAALVVGGNVEARP